MLIGIIRLVCGGGRPWKGVSYHHGRDTSFCLFLTCTAQGLAHVRTIVRRRDFCNTVNSTRLFSLSSHLHVEISCPCEPYSFSFLTALFSYYRLQLKSVEP